MRVGVSLLVLTAATVGGSVSTSAQTPTPVPTPAQTIERQSVLERARPDYDPLGIRAGSFLVFPSVAVEETYDSNIFATPDNTKSDLITSIVPEVRVQSDWNVHALSLDTRGEFRKFADNGTEDVNNFAAFLNGRLDILRDIYLQGGASYQLLHEDRGSPDGRQGLEPTEYKVTSANLSYVNRLRRIGYQVDVGVDSYDYNDVPIAGGGQINNDDRDRIVYTVSPRITYEYFPDYRAFVKATGNWRNYNAEVDNSGFNRSSNGYEFDVGTSLDISHLISGEIYAGYLSQDYDDPRLATASGLGFGGSLLWNVTQITSVRAAFARTVEETTLVNSSSYFQNAFRLSAEHELRRNLILLGGFTYINSDYETIGRTDDLYEVTAGARYLINRYLSAGADVTYRTRSSNAAGNDYDRALVAARIRGQF